MPLELHVKLHGKGELRLQMESRLALRWVIILHYPGRTSVIIRILASGKQRQRRERQRAGCMRRINDVADLEAGRRGP